MGLLVLTGRADLVLFILSLSGQTGWTAGEKPNIVFILADDLGVNDVSWNNPSAPTPTLRSLAKDGVILDTAYTLPVCSPSRAALMTGIYPYKIGFQRGFGKNLPEGLPLNVKILPEYLKDLGYSTHGFGKWHLGFCSEAYTPLKRGFDTYDGLFIGDEEDLANEESDIISAKRKLKKGWTTLYFQKQGNKSLSHEEAVPYSKFSSIDYASKTESLLKNDLKPKQPFFIYLSLLTKVYPNSMDPSKGIIEERRTKISEMDEAVKKVISSLKSTQTYENTIIVFISDNGARFIKSTDKEDDPNFPLNGYKNTIYEGGTKVPGFIHSPLLNKQGHRYSGLLHMIDFLPTFLHLSGENDVPGLDGINQWEAISENLPSPRKTMIYNMDDVFVPSVLASELVYQKFQIGIRNYRFKLIWGQSSMLHRGYRKPQYSNGGVKTEFQTLQLYDLKMDPGEKRNIAFRRKHILQKFQRLALEFYKDIVPPRFGISQSTIQVLEKTSDGGGLTGWCRAGKKTTCHKMVEPLVPYDINTTLVELFHGTVDRDNPILCTTDLEE